MHYKMIRTLAGKFKYAGSDQLFPSLEECLMSIQKSVARDLHAAFRDYISHPSVEASMVVEECMDSYLKWMRPRVEHPFHNEENNTTLSE